MRDSETYQGGVASSPSLEYIPTSGSPAVENEASDYTGGEPLLPAAPLPPRQDQQPVQNDTEAHADPSQSEREDHSSSEVSVASSSRCTRIAPETAASTDCDPALRARQELSATIKSVLERFPERRTLMLSSPQSSCDPEPFSIRPKVGRAQRISHEIVSIGASIVSVIAAGLQAAKKFNTGRSLAFIACVFGLAVTVWIVNISHGRSGDDPQQLLRAAAISHGASYVADAWRGEGGDAPASIIADRADQDGTRQRGHRSGKRQATPEAGTLPRRSNLRSVDREGQSVQKETSPPPTTSRRTISAETAPHKDLVGAAQQTKGIPRLAAMGADTPKTPPAPSADRLPGVVFSEESVKEPPLRHKDAPATMAYSIASLPEAASFASPMLSTAVNGTASQQEEAAAPPGPATTNTTESGQQQPSVLEEELTLMRQRLASLEAQLDGPPMSSDAAPPSRRPDVAVVGFGSHRHGALPAS